MSGDVHTHKEKQAIKTFHRHKEIYIRELNESVNLDSSPASESKAQRALE